MLRTLLASAALATMATSAFAVSVSIDNAPTGTMTTTVDFGDFASIDADFGNMMGAPYTPPEAIELTVTFDPGFTGSIHYDSSSGVFGQTGQFVSIAGGTPVDVFTFSSGDILADNLTGAVSVSIFVDSLNTAGFNSIDLAAKQEIVPPPIPLPAAGFLLIGGLGAMAAMRRRAKN